MVKVLRLNLPNNLEVVMLMGLAVLGGSEFKRQISCSSGVA